MLDVLIINILDELAQAVGRLERNEPPGPDKVWAKIPDGTSDY